MIDGTQRMPAAVGLGNQAIGIGRLGGIEKLAEKCGGQVRHVAGDDQVPIRGGRSQSGEESTERTAAGDRVGDHWEAEVGVAFGGADQCDVSSSFANLSGGVRGECRGAEGQQRLVAPHARALAADQQIPCAFHEKMVTSPSMLSVPNKTVYICLLLALLMTVASPSRAAEASPAPSALSGAVTPTATGRKTFVVRADPRTGKLVRSLVVAPISLGNARFAAPSGQTAKGQTATAPAKAAIRQMVEQSAKTHNVDPLLVDAVIKVESNYNPHAVSRVGAQGLMQLMPGTARDLGVSNSFDPGQNIEAGVRYLKHLQNLYKDDRLALAAYNAGPGAVDKYKQIPPYPETQNYVYQVGKRYGEARVAAANEKPASKPAALPVVIKEEEKHPKLDSFVDQNGRLHLRTTQ